MKWYAKYICDNCDIVATEDHIIVRDDSGNIDVLKFVNAEFIYLESTSELKTGIAELLFSKLHCVVENGILDEIEHILDSEQIEFIRS